MENLNASVFGIVLIIFGLVIFLIGSQLKMEWILGPPLWVLTAFIVTGVVFIISGWLTKYKLNANSEVS